MKQRGFTLIELMFVIIMLCILVVIMLGGAGLSTQNISYGVNGVMETRCVDGYKVLVGQSGHPIQMLDHHGNGIACDTETRLYRGDK